MKYIGIDTGTNTGFAIWNVDTQSFDCIDCVPIHVALERVLNLWRTDDDNDIVVRFEDARQRRWIPDTHNLRREMGRRQGAGSVKRDCQIWEDFLTDWDIPHEARAPRFNCTKLDAKQFKALTKWPARTNPHMRDAAMLVFGETHKSVTL